METLPYRQYRIKVDGSGRLTTRNRIHLRPLVPTSNSSALPPPSSRLIIPSESIVPPTQPMFTSTPNRPVNIVGKTTDPIPLTGPRPQAEASSLEEIQKSQAHQPQHNATTQISQPQNNPDLSETVPYDMTTENPATRRSTRPRAQPKRLSPTFHGKTYEK